MYINQSPKKDFKLGTETKAPMPPNDKGEILNVDISLLNSPGSINILNKSKKTEIIDVAILNDERRKKLLKFDNSSDRPINFKKLLTVDGPETILNKCGKNCDHSKCDGSHNLLSANKTPMVKREINIVEMPHLKGCDCCNLMKYSNTGKYELANKGLLRQAKNHTKMRPTYGPSVGSNNYYKFIGIGQF